LAELSEIFAIAVLAYAIMDNHKHLMLRNNPELAKSWDSEEVARRWLRLFPHRRDSSGAPAEPSEEELGAITSDPEKVEKLRRRLMDISWFMRCLKENIARRANVEDEVTGCFWEGRFKCSRLDDPGAVLSCMVYIDLNPIRAGKAKTPEESEYTSAFTRIWEQQLEAKKPTENEPSLREETSAAQKINWLCPMEKIFGDGIESKIGLADYLCLLDETGRCLAAGKQGRIPENIPAILERVGVNAKNWLETSRSFGRKFPRVAGPVEQMRAAAQAVGRKWFRGLSAARLCF
jgi:REP element-mobilizing transposase RayT